MTNPETRMVDAGHEARPAVERAGFCGNWLGGVTMTAISEKNVGSRTQIKRLDGTLITVHKSVRNNWKTTVRRHGKPNEVRPHASRKDALAFARSVE